MVARTPIVAALVLVVAVAGYAAYPCVTLYRLDGAVTRNDAAVLRRLIDWPQVRQGIEADLASGAGEQLAPFGAGFLRTIAVKAALTPETVLTALHADDRHGGPDTLRLRAAWLEGPGRLMLDLGGVRLRMELRGGAWEVTRAWLPDDVLTQARAAVRAPSQHIADQLSSSVSQ
jgi:hypothetical protein